MLLDVVIPTDSGSKHILHDEVLIRETFNLPAVPLILNLISAFCLGGYKPMCELLLKSGLLLVFSKNKNNGVIGASCDSIINSIKQCEDVVIKESIEKVFNEEDKRKKALAEQIRQQTLSKMGFTSKGQVIKLAKDLTGIDIGCGKEEEECIYCAICKEGKNMKNEMIGFVFIY
jgi:hypothetical protein